VSALLVCAAWAARLSRGTCEPIEVAMADVVAWWVGTRSGVTHVDADPATRSHGSPGYGLFGTRDGRWIALGVLAEQRLWDAICAGLGVGDLAGLDFASRMARADEVNARFAREIATLDAETALARLDASGAPVSPVLTPEAATRDPQLCARGFHVDTAAGVVAGLPGRIGAGPERPHVIPTVDEHPDGFTPR
jgi:crotonobetainyl-CoA:carnitine CoA-transferase CaiB-like acyl-CoA transferase